MFVRSLMHLPFGALASYLLFKSTPHGLAFIYLITLYQVMELYGHFQLYSEDFSWIDLEGYIIGFAYTTLSYLYLNEKLHHSNTSTVL